MKSDFGDVVKDALALVAPVRSGTRGGDVPPIQRSLAQVEALSARLGAQGEDPGAPGDARARVLLASRGADPDRLTSTLNRLDLRSTLSPLDPQPVPSGVGVATYLRHSREMCCTSAAEEARQLCARSASRSVSTRRREDWSRRRSDLLQALGRSSGVWRPQRTGGGEREGNNVNHNLNNHSYAVSSSSSSYQNQNQNQPFSPSGYSYDQGTGVFRQQGSPLGAAWADRSVSAINGSGVAGTPSRGGALGAPGAGSGGGSGTGRRMTGKELEYASAVADIVAHRSRREPFPAAWRMREACIASGGRESSDMAEHWEALAVMMGESGGDQGSPGGVSQSGRPSGPAFLGARRFLETHFYRYMTMTVREHPDQALLGGRPGLVYVVRAYMNVRLRNRGAGSGPQGEWNPELEASMVDGAPVWPQIYLCVRCGDVDAAVSVARSAPGATGDVASYLEAFGSSTSGTLPQAMWARVVSEYNSFARGGIPGGDMTRSRPDPFKVALFSLLGRVDSEALSPIVCPTTPDYLWFRLRMITDSGSGSVPVPAALEAHKVTIDDIRGTLLRYGSSHFGGGLLWFQVLLLTGMFEHAVAHLVSSGEFEVEGVHVAIVLSYYGAIKEAPGDFFNPGPPATLNLQPLVLRYAHARTHPLPRTLPYALCLSTEARREDALREMGSWGGNYSDMLGINGGAGEVLRESGPPPCPLTPHLSTASLRRLALILAPVALSKGDPHSAVSLYAAGGEAQKGVSVLCGQLARGIANSTRGGGGGGAGAVSPRGGNASAVSAEHGRFRELSRVVARAMEERGEGSSYEMATLSQLLGLGDFFDQFHAGATRDAIAIIEELGIVPSPRGDDVDAVAQYLSSLDPRVRSLFGDVALAYMTMLNGEYERVRRGNHQGGHTGAIGLPEIRARSQALVTLVGMMSMHVSGDANARIIRMHVMMS